MITHCYKSSMKYIEFAGRRIDLPVYTRLAELLEEDLYLARRCPAETSVLQSAFIV